MCITGIVKRKKRLEETIVLLVMALVVPSHIENFLLMSVTSDSAQGDWVAVLSPVPQNSKILDVGGDQNEFDPECYIYIVLDLN